MDYKEKYEQALERAKYYQKENGSAVISAIFPELAENEDEKIRKALIRYFTLSDEHAYNEACGVSYRDIVAWLEKQVSPQMVADAYLRGCNDTEKKLLEKQGDPAIPQVYETKNGEAITYSESEGYKFVEPKFKVGDCLVHKKMVGVTCCIAQIHAPHYYSTNNNSFIKFGEEDNYRPWTIHDAKDGDVLTDGKKIVIFKQFDEPVYGQHIIAHIGLDIGGYIQVTDGTWKFKEIKPATKEQRDALMKAMADAGYTFDFEKKELKKIEQKPAWSEEDELMLNDIIMCGEQHCQLDYGNIVWLKSLKERMTNG